MLHTRLLKYFKLMKRQKTFFLIFFFYRQEKKLLRGCAESESLRSKLRGNMTQRDSRCSHEFANRPREITELGLTRSFPKLRH